MTLSEASRSHQPGRRTARTFGLDIPDKLLAIADEVIRRLTPERWGNRPASLWIAGRFGVLRFRLMVNEVRICGLKHQKEKRSMDYFAGLDVSVKETSGCIVDDAGKIVREARVASEPEALLQVLTNILYRFKRVGLEAGPLSQWLYSVLAEAGLPVICVETRHMRAVLKAQINKTDRNDARGIAQMMRVGALSSGAREDVTQPEAADAVDPSQAAAVEGHRHRERPACHLAQLRP